MQNKPWYKNPEMIIALSALIVSLITAFIGIYSAYIDRAYSRASVWPRLEIFRSANQDKFEYGVINNGTGPAIIKYAKISYNGKSIQYWKDIPAASNYIQSHLGSRILSSQATITPLLIKDKTLAKNYLKADKVVQIELCYCSIYDECWLIDRYNQAKPIDFCRIDEKQRFLQ